MLGVIGSDVYKYCLIKSFFFAWVSSSPFIVQLDRSLVSAVFEGKNLF